MEFMPLMDMVIERGEREGKKMIEKKTVIHLLGKLPLIAQAHTHTSKSVHSNVSELQR